MLMTTERERVKTISIPNLGGSGSLWSQQQQQHLQDMGKGSLDRTLRCDIPHAISRQCRLGFHFYFSPG